MNRFFPKTLSPIVVITLYVSIALTLCSCRDLNKTQDKNKEELQKIETKQLDQKVNELSIKYNAISDWHQKLTPLSFTIELEEALIRRDARPVIFSGVLVDIVKNGENNVLYFRVWSPQILFILQSDSEQIKRIMEPVGLRGQFQMSWSKFSVVANIASVKRIAFEVEAGVEDVYLDIPSFDPPFVAKGNCVDFVLLEK